MTPGTVPSRGVVFLVHAPPGPLTRPKISPQVSERNGAEQ